MNKRHISIMVLFTIICMSLFSTTNSIAEQSLSATSTTTQSSSTALTSSAAVLLSQNGAMWAALSVDGKDGNPAIGDEVYMEVVIKLDKEIAGAGNGKYLLRLCTTKDENLGIINDLTNLERDKFILITSIINDNKGMIPEGTTQLWVNVYNLQEKGLIELNHINVYGIRNGKRIDYIIPNNDFAKPIEKGFWDFLNIKWQVAKVESTKIPEKQRIIPPYKTKNNVKKPPFKPINIPRIDMMPNMPPQFNMRDWNKVAKDFDKLVFDFNKKGDFLPIVWIDKAQRNFAQDTFGLPAYVGDNRQKAGENHEGITALSAVLGATLSGINKSNQNGYNFVKMCQNYFNKANGENVVLDLTNADTGHTFWYELYPGILFFSLADSYPKLENMSSIMKQTADRWHDASYEMGVKDGEPNFDYNSFDLDTMKPVEDLWSEPDSAAGIAWMEYMAYMKWKDKKYLNAADWGMSFLANREDNPYYEILLPYGAYLAARMNGEQNRNYDVKKLVNWCFDIDPMAARPGIGVATGKWGTTNVDGLYNVFGDNKFYAFTMNTFSMAAPLVPMVRYDARFAKAIGKWMLNAANNARLFYGNAWPEDQQTSAFWKGDPNYSIAYEGLNQNWGLKSPYAMGDPIRWGWGQTDFGIYGSSHVGIFGGLIAPTNDKKIIRLDCLKTDFFHDKAYPTYLYYNPYSSTKTISVDVGQNRRDIYDTVSKKYLAKSVKGKVSIKLPANNATVTVITPAGGKVKYSVNKMLVDGVVVDYIVK